eukprot:9054847-Pyramimonas_sp.AAC.1
MPRDSRRRPLDGPHIASPQRERIIRIFPGLELPLVSVSVSESVFEHRSRVRPLASLDRATGRRTLEEAQKEEDGLQWSR